VTFLSHNRCGVVRGSVDAATLRCVVVLHTRKEKVTTTMNDSPTVMPGYFAKTSKKI